jgi:hypothetical protein
MAKQSNTSARSGAFIQPVHNKKMNLFRKGEILGSTTAFAICEMAGVPDDVEIDVVVNTAGTEIFMGGVVKHYQNPHIKRTRKQPQFDVVDLGRTLRVVTVAEALRENISDFDSAVAYAMKLQGNEKPAEEKAELPDFVKDGFAMAEGATKVVDAVSVTQTLDAQKPEMN